jgi:hypothetical protein
VPDVYDSIGTPTDDGHRSQRQNAAEAGTDTCGAFKLIPRLALRDPEPQTHLRPAILPSSGGDSSVDSKETQAVADPVLEEVRDLLAEIRDLLIPVYDEHLAGYQERQAERTADLRANVTALLSTDKRKKAWNLADGTRSQRQIATESGMDEGGASKFFKQLRSLRVVEDDPNPKRTMEVD